MSYLDCYCDYESPAVERTKIVKARKAHKCYECRRSIRVGERYEYTFQVYDGYPESYHLCENCRDIRVFVSNNLPCFCWAWGSLLDDAKEAIKEAYYRAGDEVRGVAFGLGRLIVKAKRARASA